MSGRYNILQRDTDGDLVSLARPLAPVAENRRRKHAASTTQFSVAHGNPVGSSAIHGGLTRDVV
jgi:hypothetical protein